MMFSDPLLLARIQFAANITFHILFPTITIALSWILVFFKVRFQQTQASHWMEAYTFWTKVFSLSFALGVVSGITMSFQFGTNWPGFMQTVGNIAGPLLAFEVLTAFFLEATFLGIMLFGMRRVPPWLHTTATLLVAIGTTLSAFWILVLNSWMQTPQGFEIQEGVVHATHWREIIFNPSMPYRIIHMLLASGLTASFLLAGLSAYQWMKGKNTPAVIVALKTGTYLAALLIPLQIWVGDLHGLNTLKYQPAKIAAIEALWETQKGAPLILLGHPNEETKTTDYAFSVPKGSSLILTHSLEGEIKGLNEFENNHPPVLPLFWAFRLMVGMGILMGLVAWTTSFFLYNQKELPCLLKGILVAMTFSGWIATLSGWYVTEIGRQPWLVYNVLKVQDAVSAIPAPTVMTSLVLYLGLYIFLTIAFIATLFHMAKR